MTATGFATSCAIGPDEAANRESLSAMVEEINGLAASAGWTGVKVTAFWRQGDYAALQVAPGVAPLTLDYLRRLKAAGLPTPQPPAEPGQQGSLL